jgi:hypothetical protein
MNEEGSIIGVFPEALPYSNTGEQGRHDETSDGEPGAGGDPDGTTVEFWHHRAEDFPLQRESIHTWCISCPPSVVSRQQEIEEP